MQHRCHSLVRCSQNLADVLEHGGPFQVVCVPALQNARQTKTARWQARRTFSRPPIQSILPPQQAARVLRCVLCGTKNFRPAHDARRPCEPCALCMLPCAQTQQVNKKRKADRAQAPKARVEPEVEEPAFDLTAAASK